MLDNNPDIKREIYDPDTRHKKIILSALSFNDYLNSSRRQTSKHFLKRKVKAAFEREPIEKGKGFCFNVPFLPNLSMFSTPQPTQPLPTAQSRPITGSQSSHSSQSSQRVAQGVGVSSSAGTVSINLNQTNKDVDNSQVSSRNLFNVNQSAIQSQGQSAGHAGHQKQPLMMARPEERRPMPSGDNVHTINRQQTPQTPQNQSSNPNNQNNYSNNFTPQSTQSTSINSSVGSKPRYSTQGYTPEQIDAIRQKMLLKHIQKAHENSGLAGPSNYGGHSNSNNNSNTAPNPVVNAQTPLNNPGQHHSNPPQSSVNNSGLTITSVSVQQSNTSTTPSVNQIKTPIIAETNKISQTNNIQPSSSSSSSLIPNPTMSISNNINQLINSQSSGASNIQINNNIASTGSGQNNNSNNSVAQQANVNMEFIRQQQVKYNKLLEIYKTDPDKLRREIGPEEFAKFQAILIKSINLKKSQGSTQQGNPSSSVNNIQKSQSGQSAIVPSNSNNFVMESKSNS